MINKRQFHQILIITDDQFSGESLELVLLHYQFHVRTVQTCKEGEKISDQFQPDVILVDFLTPTEAGVEICKKIRSFSTAPILVLSTVDKPGIVEEMLNAGADEYLVKPAPVTLLVAHLKKLCRRYQVERNADSVMEKICYDDINDQFWF